METKPLISNPQSLSLLTSYRGSSRYENNEYIDN